MSTFLVSLTSTLAKVDVRETKKVDIVLNKGCYRIHSQVVKVQPDEKDKDNIYY